MASRFSLEALLTMNDRMTAPLKKMTGSVTAFSSTVQNEMTKANKASMMKNGFQMAMGAAGFVGVAALVKEGISGIVREASNFENAVTDFTTLTGSMQNAQNTVRNLQKLGAETPFEFGDLAASTKTLLGFQAVTQDQLIPTLRMLGDTAGGNAEKFKSITLAYSQIQAGGKASMQDINQLINAGVPILGQLAKGWGVNVAQARKMIESGKATGDVVTAAFQRMTGAGGLFSGGMARASETLTGKWSTFQDTMKMTAASLGEALLPMLKSGLDKMISGFTAISDWVSANKDTIAAVFSVVGTVLAVVASVLPYVAAGLLGYAAALGAVKAVQIATMAIGWIKYLWMMREFITAATIKQWLFNIALSANPIGLVCGLIGVAVGLFALLASKVGGVVPALKVVGQTLLKWLLIPLNLVLDVVRGFIWLLSKIPKIGKEFSGGLAELTAAQQSMNQALTGSSSQFDLREPYKQAAAQAAYRSPQTAQSGTTNTNVSQVDVNFNNTPDGTTVQRSGRTAPGTTLNLGVN